MIVNNTSADLRDFGIEAILCEALRADDPLAYASQYPAIFYFFAIGLINVNGERRLIVNWSSLDDRLADAQDGFGA